MRSLILTLLLLLPSALSAQVAISEIMYDLEGSDSGREWIEIHNTSDSGVDLAGWKFFENDTNHGLSISQGSAVLPPSGYAIIADDASAFLSDYSGFLGTVFDSSFSLRNDGEALSIRDPEGNDIDSVTYSSDWGGAGDGNSLQFASGAWRAAPPTPGEGGAGTGDSNAGAPVPPSSSSPESARVAEPKPKEPEFLTVEAGPDRAALAGAAQYFEAQAYKENGDKHPYATYRWNFGNGVVEEGKKVLHQYNHPGTYLVWVAAMTADKLSATDRFSVVVELPELVITDATGDYIRLQNNSNRELDLSLWGLRAGGSAFSFPENTVLLPGMSIAFERAVTGLNGTFGPQLLFPDGSVAISYVGTAPASRSTAALESGAGDSAAARDPEVLDDVENDEETPVISAETRLVLPTSTQIASVGVAGDSSDRFSLFVFLLLGLLLLATVSLLIFPGEEGSSTVAIEVGNERNTNMPSAQEFTIVEKKD